tara:strand:- start:67 stop:261 length:195 start_codon:yes stop_codon:yes gene_type:complete
MDIIPLNHPVGIIQGQLMDITESWVDQEINDTEYYDQLCTIWNMVDRRLNTLSKKWLDDSLAEE